MRESDWEGLIRVLWYCVCLCVKKEVVLDDLFFYFPYLINFFKVLKKFRQKFEKIEK